MERVIVNSSSLASIGYDETTHILEVEFNYGGIYQYYFVPRQCHQELMTASSHGTYFERNIKKAGYSYKRIS